MQGLKLQEWGAGAILKDYEEHLYTKAIREFLKVNRTFLNHCAYMNQ
ncbi:MAG: hypothetical protein Ct9H300mP28_19980 [Pseudomonadota bacterium]|nr:MAG: hypothetical protein Ct9H300mP28_19980 [Pseudomonadota bacterium]